LHKARRIALAYLRHTVYPKIHRFGHTENIEFFNYDDEVFVEEKIDGANFQFAVAGEPVPGTPLPVRFGSRNQDTDKGNNQWAETVEALEVILEGKFDLLEAKYIYYVEAMKPHTIQYDWERTPKVIGLDIYDPLLGAMTPYEEKLIIFEKLGISVVPLIWRGQLSEISAKKLEETLPESMYYDGPAEGIVVKNYERPNRYGRPLFCKLVRDEFKEENLRWHRKQRQKEKALEPQPHTLIAERFGTSARIRKIALKIASEKGEGIGLELMGDMIKAVTEDILEEEILTICYDYENLSFKKLRSTLAPIIKHEIEQLMFDRAEEVRVRAQKEREEEKLREEREQL